jgi:two-component system cell cycle response regulator
MRVVLVDPSRSVLNSVSRLLEARGHDVRPFTDEGEALDCIRLDLEVDALITNAELTTMSGLEVCWEARLLTTTRRQIYVILMSSNYDRNSLAEALDSGADDFIGKPPVAEELYARLRAAERLAAMQRELIRLATTDSLTSLLNRRAFFEGAQDAAERAAADGMLCAIMFDIDNFKKINDSHGHDVGDEVIRGVARAATIESAIVGHAVVGRLGGEEFAILLEGRAFADVMEIAERLRGRIAALRFEAGDSALTVSCSFGVSQWQSGFSVDRLLKLADVALYRAKQGGRNRVTAAEADVSMVPEIGWGGVSRSRQRA